MSKQLDFTKKTGITVKMPDGDFLLRKPTLAEIKVLQTEEKKAKDDLQPMINLLETVGFPEEQSLKLDADQVDQLIESLMPEKKRA